MAACVARQKPNLNVDKLTDKSNETPETTTYVRRERMANGNGDAGSVYSGTTVTTITRQITKITVIKSQEQNFRRAGLVFDDNGKLISESAAYQNFAKNFRSTLIDNANATVPAILANVGDVVNVCDNCSDTDRATSSTISPMNDSAIVQCNNGKDDVGIAAIDCEHTSCSISDRLITSKNLDDEIEFIDSSSSMSDICSVSNYAADDIYFNTLPKQPKSYASIKQQHVEPKSSAEIILQRQVETECNPTRLFIICRADGHRLPLGH